MTNLTTGLIVTAVVFVPVAIMYYFVVTAPTGYETDDGFFYGEEHSDFDGDDL